MGRPIASLAGFLFLYPAGAFQTAGIHPVSTAPQVPGLDDVETVMNSLWEIAADLNKAVRSYHRRLDEAVAKYDHGPGSAASGVSGRDAGVTQAAVRKAHSARMLAVAEDPEYQPGLLTGLNEIRSLILAARQRIAAGDEVNRWLLVVSPRELTSGEAGSKKARHAQLLKAREAARVAANRALVELPIPLPEDHSLKEEALTGIFMGRSAPREREHAPEEAAPADIPLRLEPGKRITLVSESGYRMALTDLKLESPKGRWFFYQEEWVQRGRTALRMDQLAAVDTRTGQHVLIKRYPQREFAGAVEDVYKLAGLNETRFARPPDVEPSRPEVESAQAEMARLPPDLLAARQHYIGALRTGLERSDQRHLDKGQLVLDPGLPEDARLNLYAIRGHLLRVAAVLNAEKRLRDQIDQAAKRIDELKRLAAWANRTTPEQDSSAALPAAEWERIQSKADDAIYAARQSVAAALAALPPDLGQKQAKFPALLKDGIVHMVGVHASVGSDRAIWQEVWDWDATASGSRRARQGIDTIVVDPDTGDQIRVGRQTNYYRVDRGESLVDAYERLGGPVAPPREVVVEPDLFSRR